MLLVSLTCFGALAAPIADADVIDTYVGGGSGDGAPAIDAIIDPRGVVAVGDPQRPDLYIADGKNNRVRRVRAATGLIETIAGTGVGGFSGDGGSAQNAMLKFPLDVAVDGAGNVYIVDLFNNRVRKVTPQGQISTFAGNGVQTFNGDGLATQASLSNPYGVTVAPDGYVYIADFGNNRIRKVGPPGCTPSTCVIATVAGNGNWGYNGDNGQATSAALRSPSDMTFDGAGNMYIADWANNRIRRVAPNGVITTVAGGGQIGANGSIGDGGNALLAVLNGPVQVAVDTSNNLYIADSNYHRIRMLQPASQIITTVAGTGGTGTTGDGGAPTTADLYATWGVAATTAGTFWLSQTTELPISLNNRVRRVDSYQVIRSVVGGGLGNGGAAIDALVDPRGTEAVDHGGAFPDLYFADGTNNVVRHVDGSTGIIETLAGTGAAGYGGDGGNALNATLRTPLDVAYDENSGDVYVADTFNNVIRKISRGVITTFAGDGNWGYVDGGSARAARFASPRGIDVDSAGNLFIADYENNRVRKVSGGTVTTVAGNGNWGYGGDNGLATAAQLRNPSDVLVADDGSMYIADAQNNRIRRVSPAGIITTYAGNGGSGFTGDGGLATLAKLNIPTTLALDDGGNLYIGDSRNNRVRRVDPVRLTIQTVAGNGQIGASGDGGAALTASFSEPTGVGVAPTGGMLFIGSKDDYRIRIVAFSGAVPPTSTPAPPATATFTATATWTSIPSTPTRTPTITQTPTRTGTATNTSTSGASGAVSGHVKYYINQGAVPNVEVDLTGPMTATVQTNPTGTYSASGIPQGTVSLLPGKWGGFGSAVSSLDAARVLQVIAGLQSFTGLQRLACDVTGDGGLSALDAVRILQFSAGVIEQMPVAQICGSDWIFYPSPGAPGQTIPPSVSAGTCQQGSIVVDPAGGAVPNQDFDAILFGDCTGNWSVTNGGSLRLGAVVHAGSARRVRGNRVRVPIYVQARAPFQALDLTVSYDATALRFAAVQPRGAAADALVSVNDATPGRLTVSLADGAAIDAAHGAVLYLDFAAGDGACGAVRLAGAAVNEQPARVVSHGRCR